jgi:4-hydroxybenzoate polyprenyltransferase
MIGRQAQLGTSYFIALTLASGFFVYQMKLIWNREPEHCMKAFLNNNYFGLTVFIGLFINFIIINHV